MWSDSNRQYNYYAAHILRDVEEDEDNQNTIYAETEASQVEAAAATAAAPADNVVVHDDHEQLLSGDDEDIIQVVGSAVINITDEGEQADERDPRIPSRDLNATVKNVPYGLALGTLEFGTMNVMNCEYESHNYRQPSSMLRKQYNARVLTTNTYTGIEIMRVLMSAVIGAVTGLTGLMISVSIENFAKPKYAVFAHFLNKLKYDPDGHSLALPLFVACVVTVGVNVSLVLCAALLGCYSPVSTGSGIPHIKAYLNGVKIPKVRILALALRETIRYIFQPSLPTGPAYQHLLLQGCRCHFQRCGRNASRKCQLSSCPYLICRQPYVLSFREKKVR